MNVESYLTTGLDLQKALGELNRALVAHRLVEGDMTIFIHEDYGNYPNRPAGKYLGLCVKDSPTDR